MPPVNTMTEREAILARVREALAVPAPLPGSHDPGSAGVSPAGTPALPNAPKRPLIGDARQWLPRVGQTFDEQLALFRANAADLKAEFQLLASFDELPAALAKIRNAEKWQRVASHDGELAGAVAASLGLPICRTDGGYDVQELERCDVGITECDALVAQTGSVVLTSRSAGGRALSVLPPHHVVIARREQLVPDLPAAFELLQRKCAPDFPSMISFVTGPSRTGDIERILVLGAHGPKKLTVLCF